MVCGAVCHKMPCKTAITAHICGIWFFHYRPLPQDALQNSNFSSYLWHLVFPLQTFATRCPAKLQFQLISVAFGLGGPAGLPCRDCFICESLMPGKRFPQEPLQWPAKWPWRAAKGQQCLSAHARVLLTFREPGMSAVHCRRRGLSCPGIRFL